MRILLIPLLMLLSLEGHSKTLGIKTKNGKSMFRRCANYVDANTVYQNGFLEGQVCTEVEFILKDQEKESVLNSITLDLNNDLILEDSDIPNTFKCSASSNSYTYKLTIGDTEHLQHCINSKLNLILAKRTFPNCQHYEPDMGDYLNTWFTPAYLFVKFTGIDRILPYAASLIFTPITLTIDILRYPKIKKGPKEQKGYRVTNSIYDIHQNNFYNKFKRVSPKFFEKVRSKIEMLNLDDTNLYCENIVSIHK